MNEFWFNNSIGGAVQKEIDAINENKRLENKPNALRSRCKLSKILRKLKKIINIYVI